MNIGTEQVFIVNASELDQHIPTPLQRTFTIPGTALQTEEAHTSMCLPQSMEPPSRTQMCRLCATITEMVVPIFQGEGLQNNLADKIHQHLPIQVSEDDLLPIVLCFQCSSTLLAWHELVVCSLQADSVMRERFNLSHSHQQQQQRPIVQSSQTQIKDEKLDLEAEKPEEKEEEVEESLRETDIPRTVVSSGRRRRARCGVCGRAVAAAAWRRHARAHAGPRGTRYSCHECGRAFTDGANLARHAAALHSPRRPHRCPRCPLAFTRAEHLREHARSHSPARDFLCDTCGHASGSQAALRMHRLTHGPPKHGCVLCGARFKRLGELRAHVSVHSGEKPHECALCARTFRLRAQLTRHARTHRNEFA